MSSLVIVAASIVIIGIVVPVVVIGSLEMMVGLGIIWMPVVRVASASVLVMMATMAMQVVILVMVSSRPSLACIV